MDSQDPISLAALKARIGEEVGISSWIEIDQDRIDVFADATLDHQFIHTDIARARETAFGGTIAHGFLTLSLVSHMSFEGVPAIEGAGMVINYGIEKLRFLSPVRSGRRVRGHFTLSDITEKGPQRALITYSLSIEIEGEDRPALVADWLALLEFDN